MRNGHVSTLYLIDSRLTATDERVLRSIAISAGNTFIADAGARISVDQFRRARPAQSSCHAMERALAQRAAEIQDAR